MESIYYQVLAELGNRETVDSFDIDELMTMYSIILKKNGATEK